MLNLTESALRTLNDILTAGIAITAFSLLVYALSLNLKDRVTRSFVIILACVVVVFLGEALGSVASTTDQLEFWMRFQWLGIVFLPAAYLQLSDSLLATTGRPSRWPQAFFRSSGLCTFFCISGYAAVPTAGWRPDPGCRSGAAFSAHLVYLDIYHLLCIRDRFFILQFVESIRTHDYACQPAADAVSHGWRVGTRSWFIPLPVIWFRNCCTEYANFLAGGHIQQPACICLAGSDGICSGIFWGILARPYRKEASAQMGHAWSGNRFGGPGNNHHRAAVDRSPGDRCFCGDLGDHGCLDLDL